MHKYKKHVQYKNKPVTRDKTERIIHKLLENILIDKQGIFLLAVGGPGGTGKSTFCKELGRLMDDCSVLRLDDYKTPRSFRQPRNIFGPHPDANEMDLLKEHLAALKQGRPIEKPIYDPDHGAAKSTEPFSPSRIIILDGEISTYRDFRNMIDFSIFIDADWQTQLTTRITRDIDERGYTREKAIATFLQSNLREFAQYGAESKKWADIHLYCHEDYQLEVESVSQELYDVFENELKKEFTPVEMNGLIIPVMTAFDKNNQVDREMFIAHLEYLANHGVTRIMVNGTTGEFFSLHPTEKKLLLSIARSYFPGLVLFQAGSESLIQTEEGIAWAQEYGADGVVVLPPYYYAGAPEDGLVQYFNHLASCTDLPLLIYNFPKHTGNSLSAEMLKQINHVGMKDSSGNVELIPATPNYFMGGDRKILKGYQAGACGFVSSRANAFPWLYVAIEKAWRDGQTEQVETLQQAILDVCHIVSGTTEITMLKHVLAMQIPNYPLKVRLPLLPLSAEQQTKLEQAIAPILQAAPKI